MQLHTFQEPAHIVDMGRLILYSVLAVMIVAFLLFVPIVLEADAHYDMNRRKFGFAVFLYKIFKLFGGYAATYQGGLALHVSPKKAILIPYSEIDSERKRFSFVRSFRFIAFTLTTETGAEYLLPVSLAHTALRTLFFLLGGSKDKIENIVEKILLGYSCVAAEVGRVEILVEVASYHLFDPHVDGKGIELGKAEEQSAACYL